MLQKPRVLAAFCTAAWPKFGYNPVFLMGFPKLHRQKLAKTRAFSFFVLLLVAKSSKTPNFNLDLQHAEDKILEQTRLLATFCKASCSIFG